MSFDALCSRRASSAAVADLRVDNRLPDDGEALLEDERRVTLEPVAVTRDGTADSSATGTRR